MDGASAIEASFRADAGRAIAYLASALRDIHRAEDAVQEAYITALERWPRDGMPRNPAAWIVATARNRAIDRLRREQSGARKLELLARLERADARLREPDEDGLAGFPDERLGFMFACCHPSLSLEASIALTLRTLGGLTTDEIARAFLVPPSTMAQRLVRAKHKIRDAGIPFGVPEAERLPERVDAICSVLYLIFNEGYAAATGEHVVRTDLCDEAIRLARLLVSALENDAEVHALLALMLLQDARRAARTSAAGEVVSLEDQDRSLWHAVKLAEGLRALDRARSTGQEGPYQLQAEIAAVHARAHEAASTDWSTIALLYGKLASLTRSPVVELNQAVAIAMAADVEAALAIVDRLDGEGALEGYYYLHAARADFLRRLGRLDAAIDSYAQALALAKNAPESRFLEKRVADLANAGSLT